MTLLFVFLSVENYAPQWNGKKTSGPIYKFPAWWEAKPHGRGFLDKPITLKCRARGLPKPTTTWLKDGAPLVPGECDHVSPQSWTFLVSN